MSTRTTILEEDSEGRLDPGEEGLTLFVLSPDSFACLSLEGRTEVSIGRSTGCDVHLDDPMASRRHARLLAEPPHLAIEDLGSANGTRVRGTLLRGAPSPLEVGEAVMIGTTVLVVEQSRGAATDRRHLWSHAYFEGRLREECNRARATGAPFAVVRLHLEQPLTWIRAVPALARDVRPPHFFAAYGPNEYELLLHESSVERVQTLVEAVRGGFRALGVGTTAGTAWFPRDGRSGDALLERANAELRPAPPPPSAVDGEISSPAMRGVRDLANRAAGSDISVLLLGETGVGKDVMARNIHRLSPRRDRPFLALNCAGLTESLIESELFGYTKGAFTGAVQSKPGLLETAQGGTVFLDEIGDMPPTIQARLLRVIETRQVLPVGGLTARPIDVRFLAATNRDLEIDVEREIFRRDLFFRLNGITLSIPPLRERRQEILPLARAFLAQAASVAGLHPVPSLTAEACELLEDYDWPGNIRELKNIAERALVLCEDQVIDLEHLPVEKIRGWTPAPPSARAPSANESSDSGSSEPDSEKKRILDALAVCAGNQSRAAKLLGMARRTFVSKLDLYGVPRPQKDKRGG